MHILRKPSLFFTNKTLPPHEEILGLIKPLSSKSLSLSLQHIQFGQSHPIRRIDMGFLSDNKSIQKYISCSGGLRGRSLRKSSRNSHKIQTDSMGQISESKSRTIVIWYKHHLEIILPSFKQEILRSLGIEFPPFHSTIGLFGKLNFTTLVLQLIEPKQEYNQSIPK